MKFVTLLLLLVVFTLGCSDGGEDAKPRAPSLDSGSENQVCRPDLSYFIFFKQVSSVVESFKINLLFDIDTVKISEGLQGSACKSAELQFSIAEYGPLSVPSQSVKDMVVLTNWKNVYKEQVIFNSLTIPGEKYYRLCLRVSLGGASYSSAVCNSFFVEDYTPPPTPKLNGFRIEQVVYTTNGMYDVALNPLGTRDFPSDPESSSNVYYALVDMDNNFLEGWDQTLGMRNLYRSAMQKSTTYKLLVKSINRRGLESPIVVYPFYNPNTVYLTLKFYSQNGAVRQDCASTVLFPENQTAYIGASLGLCEKSVAGNNITFDCRSKQYCSSNGCGYIFKDLDTDKNYCSSWTIKQSNIFY